MAVEQKIIRRGVIKKDRAAGMELKKDSVSSNRKISRGMLCLMILDR